MANAVAITLAALVADGELAHPTADVLDTGTAPVTLPCDVGAKSDRVIFMVTNTAANNLTVTVESGVDPPAFRAGLGDYVSAVIAQNAVRWLGPFESARFIDAAGKLNLTFTPASGTIACNVRAFRLPKV